MIALPTTTMTAVIRSILSVMNAHAWPSPVAQIGFRGPTDLIQLDVDAVRLATPALYLHLSDRRGDEEGTERKGPTSGRVMRICRFSVYCLLGQSTPDLPIEIYEMSESVCSLVERTEFSQSARRGNRWGLMAAVGYPINLIDTEADLGINGVASRVVHWDQAVYLQSLPSVS